MIAALGLRHKLVAMPVLRPDDQTAVNESELDIDEDSIDDPEQEEPAQQSPKDTDESQPEIVQVEINEA